MDFIEEEGGQLTFLPASMDTRQRVVQSNPLIYGRQDLPLNAARLVRLAIMQIKPNDTALKPYSISVRDYAALIGNADSSNLYHAIRSLCADLMASTIEIRTQDGAWRQYHWVSWCGYEPQKKEIQIQLDSSLQDFFVRLTGNYTQYRMLDALGFRSVYALRMYELILGKSKHSRESMPTEGIHAEITVEEIRNACSLYRSNENGEKDTTAPKFAKISQLKAKVIDIAMREINEKITDLSVSYECVKSGHTITSFDFFIRKIADTTHQEPYVKPKRAERRQSKHNTFNDFEQNQYDFDTLEKQLLNN